MRKKKSPIIQAKSSHRSTVKPLDTTAPQEKSGKNTRSVPENNQIENRLRKFNRLYLLLSEINQSIVRIRKPQALIKAVCRIAVEKGGFRMAWIGLLDPQTKCMKSTASAGVKDDFLDRQNIKMDSNGNGRDPISTAMRTGKHAVINDINNDPDMAPWHTSAQRLGYCSSAAMPLITSGKVRGVFNLYSSEPGFFDNDEMKLLDEMASDIAFALEFAVQEEQRQRAELLLRESEQRYQTLAQISPVGIFRTDANGSTTYVNPKWCEISGLSADQGLGYGWLNAVHPDDKEKISAGWRESVKFHKGSITDYRFLHPDGTVAWIMGQAVAELDSENQLVGYVGTIIDITDRKWAQNNIENYLRKLSTLRAIDIAITSSFDLRVTLDVLLGHVITQLRVDAAAVLILDPKINELVYANGRGFYGNGITRLRLRLGEDYAGRAALERHIVKIPNIKEIDIPFTRQELTAGENFIAFYAVPLIAKGQVKGVLEVFHREVLNPDLEWLDFLKALAGQAAIAVDNAQLFDGLQRSNDELEVAYDATIEGWSRALDLRDKDTEGHTLRLTDLTVKLARLAGLSPKETTFVRRGALLHDIGKIGVPDSILLKPGSLTDEERAAIQKHPQFAYDMLSSIKYLRPALDIPYCHHEKWDGTGYPRGLKGEQIPLAARLFAVMDVWDALRSDRPYRAGWPDEKVLEHIRSSAGTHFDPKAVELFFQVLRK